VPFKFNLVRHYSAEREADAGPLSCADRMALRERCFDESQRGVTHRVTAGGAGVVDDDDEEEDTYEFITAGFYIFIPMRVLGKPARARTRGGGDSCNNPRNLP
jgi:protein involved in temperature-dependent protein secretion